MTQKTNIQQFDEITAKIFAKLYEQFPIATSIECIKLTNSADGETEVCVATLTWLSEEGYIKIQNLGQHYAQGIVLTAKGLSILKTMPDSLESKRTLGEKIQTAVKAGAITTAVEIVKLVFSAGG